MTASPRWVLNLTCISCSLSTVSYSNTCIQPRIQAACVYEWHIQPLIVPATCCRCDGVAGSLLLPPGVHRLQLQSVAGPQLMGQRDYCIQLAGSYRLSCNSRLQYCFSTVVEQQKQRAGVSLSVVQACAGPGAANRHCLGCSRAVCVDSVCRLC